MKPSVLKSAILKCRRFTKKTNEWCGCLTPSEIFALINAGVQPAYDNDNHIKWLENNLKKGISNPIWFYFYPNKVVMKED